MMRNITTLLLLLTALSSCTAQGSTPLGLHAEIMGAAPAASEKPDQEETPDLCDTAIANIPVASNIRISTKAVYATYSNAEFILYYDGRVYIEINEEQPKPISASVFQLSPGIWIAEIEGGQYIKVFAQTGNTNTDLDGTFRTWQK